MSTYFLVCFISQILLSVVLLFCLNMLLLRLSIIENQISGLGKQVDHELTKLLRRILIDNDISSELGNQGLDTPMRKPFYEPASEQINTFLALIRLISTLPREDVDNQLKRISALFLLQFKMGLDPEIFTKSVSQIISGLKNQSYHGAKIVEVRIPAAGDTIDLEWMSPCSVPAGYRVRAALGIALVGNAGKLITKANVVGK
ncbi:MAG: hypothetical protein LBE18_09185 [Planctomycetaceae bacterium]|jgi:hypothetical protein|nr:hypothetical protein [Planctomycetaceae bacterium]